MSGAQHTPGPLPRDLKVRGPLAVRDYVVCWQGRVGTSLNAGSFTVSGISGVDAKAFAERIVQCVNAHDDLLTYAKCEEARTRGEDIAETVLKQHGFNPADGTSHEFMDRMRRAAIAKATGSAA